MPNPQDIYRLSLSPKQFRLLSEFVRENVGIKMPPEKQVMLEGRLRKRLRSLGMHSFKEYTEYLFSAAGLAEEAAHMIDVVTTNKTDFFREPAHFDFLVREALPRLIAELGAGVQRRLTTWSAGCSTGEEAYTLAMVLAEFGKRFPGLSFDFRIIGTDISTQVLETGKRAVYNEEKAEPIPMNYRKEYLVRSKDPARRQIRMIPRLRNCVKFRRLNFLDNDFGFREKLDIIFFRNVLIYFEKTVQRQILSRLCGYLRPGGYLFIGHSETLLEMHLPLRPAAPTIYRRLP